MLFKRQVEETRGALFIIVLTEAVRKVLARDKSKFGFVFASPLQGCLRMIIVDEFLQSVFNCSKDFESERESPVAELGDSGWANNVKRAPRKASYRKKQQHDTHHVLHFWHGLPDQVRLHLLKVVQLRENLSPPMIPICW